jgi:GNAT superfamily N-acetyltransferase
MAYRVTQTRPGDGLWRHIEQHSPQTVRYMADPEDRGDYRCFVALSARDEFIGLSIVDIGRLGFGPLADRPVACLENVLTLEPHRRQGVGTALLCAGLDAAWESDARHVWWTVDYGNVTAIAFYNSVGAAFIAEEDPQADEPERYYTVVVASPASRRGLRAH